MIRCVVALILLLVTTGQFATAAEEAVPRDMGVAAEIAPSVQFAPDVPAISLQDLHGKLVVVVFFQSWCPLCDEWSPRVFKELQDVAGNRRDVVLVAAKTDGGTMPAAVTYLKTRTDTSKWLVGLDNGSLWELAATGADALYLYTIVGPDGTMVDGGPAGQWYQESNGPRLQAPAFNLTKLLKVIQTETVLPRDKAYADVLAPAVRAAELRQYGLAIKLCDAIAKTAAKDAADLKADLQQWIADRGKTCTETLEKTDAPTDARLDAYLELKRVARDVPTTDAGKAAVKSVTAAAKDKTIAEEIQACLEYTTLHQQAAKVKDSAKSPAFRTALKAMADKHPATRFGKMAAAELVRLAFQASKPA